LSKTTSKLALGLVGLIFLFAIFSFLRENWSANQKPGFIESMLAKWALGFFRHSDGDLPNPLPATPQNLEEGRRLYEKECALCHGLDGKGQGEKGLQFYPPAPELAGRNTELSDGQIQAIVSRGVRYTAMPSFAKELTQDEIWKVVLWVRRIPAKAPAAPGSEPAGEASRGAPGTGAHPQAEPKAESEHK
jgi:mono/diheme cytochrome c family protein